MAAPAHTKDPNRMVASIPSRSPSAAQAQCECLWRLATWTVHAAAAMSCEACTARAAFDGPKRLCASHLAADTGHTCSASPIGKQSNAGLFPHQRQSCLQALAAS